MTAPSVSVVIPTVGRATLDQAVRSALDQTVPPREVLVVVDRSEPPPSLGWPDPRVRVLTTGGGRGGNGARQLGVDSAHGDVIAFLDDDDYWYATKLEQQLPLLLGARARGRLGVIGAAIQEVDEFGREVGVIPRRIIREGQSVRDYLFKRREIAWGEAAMNSSMLMVDRAIFDAVPLDESLRMHQDWDWVVRASLEPDVVFAMADVPLLVYRRQPRGQSISRGPDWRHSLAWARRNRAHLSPREYGDLLMGVTVSLAVTAGDRRGGWSVVAHALRSGRPGLPAILAGLGLLLTPHAAIVRVSSLIGRFGRRRQAER